MEDDPREARERPSQAGKRNVPVILPQERRTAKGRRHLARAVDHSANHQRVVVIGSGNCVDTENRDPQSVALQRNIQNVDRTIIFCRAGELTLVAAQSLYVNLARENFYKAIW